MAGLDEAQVEQCISLLRQADAMLMKAGELAVAVHLALVIDLLQARRRPAR